jgi:hypothetical protein
VLSFLIVEELLPAVIDTQSNLGLNNGRACESILQGLVFMPTFQGTDPLMRRVVRLRFTS